MSDFDLSRIVPSTRDLLAAIHTRRRGLALVPLVDGASDDEEAIRREVARLDALDVRAFAFTEPGVAARIVATSTSSTPCVSLAEADSAEACQRARFFGADGVGVPYGQEPALDKTAQSMRMMALAFATTVAAAERAQAAGARAVLFEGPLEQALALGQALPSPTLLVAHVADVDDDGLRKLSGAVDASIVPPAVHRGATFEALLDDLDS